MGMIAVFVDVEGDAFSDLFNLLLFVRRFDLSVLNGVVYSSEHELGLILGVVIYQLIVTVSVFSFDAVRKGQLATVSQKRQLEQLQEHKPVYQHLQKGQELLAQVEGVRSWCTVEQWLRGLCWINSADRHIVPKYYKFHVHPELIIKSPTARRLNCCVELTGGREGLSKVI